MWNMVAGDRFELPMLLAYETEVVTTLPALLFVHECNCAAKTCQAQLMHDSHMTLTDQLIDQRKIMCEI